MAGDRELRAMETTLAALQPLEPEARQRVVNWLVAKLSLAAVAPVDHGDGHEDASSPAAGNLGNIKQFLKVKAPDGDVARITALAYFLTHGKSLKEYKNGDLSKARIDAALPKFNLSRSISNAQRAGYVTTTGKRGTYQVTSTGEALVDAMPDAAAVKKVKAQSKKRRRRSTAKKGAKKATAKKA